MCCTDLFIFVAKSCDGISETPMHAITLPYFTLHVGQIAVSSYYIGDLYGELILHTPGRPFHAASISFKLLRTLNCCNWCSCLHTIPPSPIVHLFDSRELVLPFAIAIALQLSVLYPCLRDFAEVTYFTSIRHPELSPIASPSRSTYCPVFIALLTSKTGARSGSFSAEAFHSLIELVVFSSDISLFALSFTSLRIFA